MNWQARLKELKYSYMEQNTPGAFVASGGRSMRLKPYNDTTSNGLTAAIVDWPSTTVKGTFDITATVRGRSVKVEVKIGRDEMSESQLNQQAKEERAGALTFVARDMESFLTWFESYFPEEVAA